MYEGKGKESLLPIELLFAQFAWSMDQITGKRTCWVNHKNYRKRKK